MERVRIVLMTMVSSDGVTLVLSCFDLVTADFLGVAGLVLEGKHHSRQC